MMLDEDFNRVDRFGTPLCCGKRGVSDCPNFGIYQHEGQWYCAAHGWPLYRDQHKFVQVLSEASLNELAAGL
jgi:hypothetical protein